ncbi:MAG: hypothetical protein IH591_17715 [Bacteroidales bacterium]|nr:hypothetical protein [Bacteroidales bacterium]
MGVPSFFRQNKPKDFRYVPRYYDKEKEEREERIKRIKEEMGIAPGGEDKPKGIRRGSFSPKFQHTSGKMQQYTSIRLIIIILVLVLITYVFWRL